MLAIKNARLQEIVDEFSSNQRLRLGCAMVVVIFLIWVSLVWSDWNTALYKEVRALDLERSALVDIEQTDVWQSRVAEATGQLESFERRLWRADSEGVALARLQSTLSELIIRDQAVRQTIKVGVPQTLEGLDSVKKIRARIGVSLTPEQLAETLKNLDGHEQFLIIEQLSIRKRQGRWNIDMVVSGLFELAGGES